MTGADVVVALKKKLRLKTDQQLSIKLGMSLPSIQGWKRRPLVTTRQLAELVFRANRTASGNSQSGAGLVVALKRKLRLQTDKQLSAKLGMSFPSIQGWKRRTSVTPRQLAELVFRANRAGAKNMQSEAIQPLVEFFEIQGVDSKRKASVELFSTKDADGRDHPYRAGLKEQLRKHHGVYVFFDSRGQAIYTGKAKSQSLWNEIKNAYNRRRGDVQTIKRVKHPSRKQKYRTMQEKVRQITDYPVPLHELASYFSAYHVTDGMINDLEAMLVRSFANDLLNVRMERFVRQRGKKKANGR